MIFQKYNLKYEPTTITNIQIAAAKRAVKKERHKAGLFPEFMRFTNVEERLKFKDNLKKELCSRLRSFECKTWIDSRNILSTLNKEDRKNILNDFFQAHRKDSTSLAAIILGVKRDPLKYEKRKAFEDMSEVKKIKCVQLSGFVNFETNNFFKVLKKIDQCLHVNIKRASYNINGLCLIVETDQEKRIINNATKEIEKLIIRQLKIDKYKISDELIYSYAYKE